MTFSYKEMGAGFFVELEYSAQKILIAKIWEDLKSDNTQPLIQDESKATYWEGRTPFDGAINSSMTLSEVDRLVRATTHPYPGAFFKSEGKEIIIWEGQLIKPGNDLPFKEIQLSDGIYYCTDFSYGNE